jgi:uncharacterized ferritin-like protein (DUF455 family)
MTDFFRRVHGALLQPDPDLKCALASALEQEWQAGRPPLAPLAPVAPIAEPGRPSQPELVPPQSVPRRRLDTAPGRAALIHALAHIEFNAINLALDAAWRFRGLPRDFYGDWLKVAAEEAYHFRLLRDHLRGLGFDYGDFAAHSGLWDMAVRTGHDALVRMALVPRVMEARGLDVTPGIRVKLVSAGDQRAAEILDIIERDEVGHVAIGNRWYAFLCEQRGLEPVATFRQLLVDYDAPALRPPFHLAARRAAGFSEPELAWLESQGPDF